MSYSTSAQCRRFAGLNGTFELSSSALIAVGILSADCGPGLILYGISSLTSFMTGEPLTRILSHLRPPGEWDPLF